MSHKVSDIVNGVIDKLVSENLSIDPNETMEDLTKDIMNGKFRKSPMNYTGGKYRLLKQLLPLFPKDINTFVDLFCGGGDIFANVKARRVIANDTDTKVIEFYNTLKTNRIEDILGYIDATIAKFGLTIDNADGYNEFRNYYNHEENSWTKPIDLFILIAYSFNHQIRFNQKGDFNMPFGKNRSYFNETIRKNLIEFHKVIWNDNVYFVDKDFRELEIDKLGKGDFVYCDPPYLITCATYNEQGGWGQKEEDDLYALLDRLNAQGVKFGMSNVMMNKGRTNDTLIKWAEKYNVHHLNHTYSNCSYHALDRNTKGTDEVLITNY